MSSLRRTAQLLRCGCVAPSSFSNMAPLISAVSAISTSDSHHNTTNFTHLTSPWRLHRIAIRRSSGSCVRQEHLSVLHSSAKGRDAHLLSGIFPHLGYPTGDAASRISHLEGQAPPQYHHFFYLQSGTQAADSARGPYKRSNATLPPSFLHHSPPSKTVTPSLILRPLITCYSPASS